MTLTLDLGGNDVVVNSISVGAATPGSTPGSGSSLIPSDEWVSSSPLGASSTSQTIYVNPTVGGTFKILAASVVFGTASSSGTMQIEVATGTQAVGSGTSQLTGTMSLSGTANTVVNGTIVASPTTIATGSRINVILAGTLTGLANCVVTLVLARVS